VNYDVIINYNSNSGLFFFCVCDLHLPPASLLCISRFKAEPLGINYIWYISVSQRAQVSAVVMDFLLLVL